MKRSDNRKEMVCSNPACIVGGTITASHDAVRVTCAVCLLGGYKPPLDFFIHDQPEEAQAA